jgi:hypothetical protein
MTGTWLTLNTVPGITTVGSPVLFGATLLQVRREGAEFDIVSGVPDSRSVARLLNQTKLKFLNQFNPQEKVYVLYKY